MTDAESEQLDHIIVGGGIAGLWLLNQLHHSGFNGILLEADSLGSAQTLASQGMIHGGIKYALGGALTGASEAIATMPDRWRACLAGEGAVDLRGLTVLSERYYLFAEGTSLGRLTGFFASRALRGRIKRISKADYPESLSSFDGVVYALQDFVLDTRELLDRLRQPVAERIFKLRVNADALSRAPAGWSLRLPESQSALRATQLILAAGAGNGPLLAGLGLSGPAMQLRALHQVVVRHPALAPLYAHCVTAISRPEPRLTITSHPDPNDADQVLWYLGGQLATDGVDRSTADQIEHARAELRRCVPWIDWTAASFETLRIDRAEPAQSGGRRPDEAFVSAVDQCITCWPTKLSLAPDLGDKVLAHLQADGRPLSDPQPAQPLSLPPALSLPAADLGRRPW